MNENKESTKSKLVRIFFGLFLCLISLVMFLNVGYIGRSLSFIFIFFFGQASYFLYAIFFIIGLLNIVNPKKKNLGGARYIAGVVVTLLAVSSLLTYLFAKTIAFSDFGEKIGELYNVSNYYSQEFLRTFSLGIVSSANFDVAGGLLGDTVIAALNVLSIEFLPLLVVSLLLILGLALIALPLAFSIGKKIKAKGETKPKKKKEKAVPIKQEKDNFIVIDNSLETIMNASKNNAFIEEPLENAQQSSRSFTSVSKSAMSGTLNFADINHVPSGGLKKAFFKKDEEIFEEESSTLKPLGASKDVPINEPKPEKRYQVEQMSFNFDVSDKKDDSLVSVKPVFAEVIEKKTVVETKVERPAPSKKVRVKFIPPDETLLATYEVKDASAKNIEVAEQRKDRINEIFQDFKIGANCISYVVGPAVTRFNVAYDSSVSIRAVSSSFDDIQLRLGGIVGRFQPIVEGEPYSGMELPNHSVTMVSFKDVATALPNYEKKPLSIAFGKDIAGNIVYADLNEFPHMLISGTTGSGKSIFIHSVLMTLISRNNPDDLKIVLVDPKRVEMAMYGGEPHLLCPIITEASKAKVCMEKLDAEMERRYGILAKTGNTDMKTYREYCKDNPDAEWLPYIVVVLDEYADLVDRAKDIQPFVVSVAQKARAAGIHVIISTQRPSTNVITGVLKGNLPTRVALMTSSAVDSITIIGEGGAEKLLGKGDMLIQSPLISRTGCVRLQGCYVSNKEIGRVVEYLKTNYETEYNPEFLDLTDHSKEPTTPRFSSLEEGTASTDDKYEMVKEMVMQQDYTSISRIQREFGFGFSRAGKIFKSLQDEGIVANAPDTPGSSKGCKVLIHGDYYDAPVEIGSSEVTTFERDEN